MTEYSHVEVERKFADSFVKFQYRPSAASLPTTLYGQCVGVSKVNDEVFAYFEVDGTHYEGRVETFCFPATTYPKIEFRYWLPDPGIYQDIKNPGVGVLLKRRLGRHFKLGLNVDSYMAFRLTADGLLDCRATNCNVLAGLPGDPNIWSKDVFFNLGRVFFHHTPIGIGDERHLFLDHEVFKSFIPQRILDQCQLHF